MRLPLILLAVGAVLAGMVFYNGFVGHDSEHFFGPAIAIGEGNHVLHDYHGVPAWVALSPFAAMLLGLFTAWMFYVKRPEIPGQLAARHHGLYQFLLNKWYFDELYDAIFVNPAKRLGTFLWKRGDGGTVDGAINGLTMGLIPWVTRLAGRMQSGFLFHYAFVMLIGVSILITLMSVGGGAGGAH
jgi:NADH-quinone oxidoreductase subunit L